MPSSNYTKPQISVISQIALLKQYGLSITDETYATHILRNISYYRLKSYLKPLRQTGSKTFKEGASFGQAYSLYQFDSDLRKLIYAELEKIEISVRTQLSLLLSESYGIYWFTESSLFKDNNHHSMLLHKLTEELHRSDEDTIILFRKKYDNPLPPSWMTFEISSFGTMSMAYRYLRSCPARRNLAKFYGLSDSVMESWLHTIAYVRNICAHHGRLWNKRLSINASVPKTPRLQFLKNIPHDTKKLYYTLSIIIYLLQSINPQSSFSTRFKRLLKTYPNVDTRAMGFPSDWESEPLWQ